MGAGSQWGGWDSRDGQPTCCTQTARLGGSRGEESVHGIQSSLPVPNSVHGHLVTLPVQFPLHPRSQQLALTLLGGFPRPFPHLHLPPPVPTWGVWNCAAEHRAQGELEGHHDQAVPPARPRGCDQCRGQAATGGEWGRGGECAQSCWPPCTSRLAGVGGGGGSSLPWGLSCTVFLL